MRIENFSVPLFDLYGDVELGDVCWPDKYESFSISSGDNTNFCVNGTNTMINMRFKHGINCSRYCAYLAITDRFYIIQVF